MGQLSGKRASKSKSHQWAIRFYLVLRTTQQQEIDYLENQDGLLKAFEFV